jgi:hypothetical protein
MDVNNVWHVVPLNDTYDHYEAVFNDGVDVFCDCDCEPSVSKEENGFIVVHHSFDGREGMEVVSEILNNK